MGFQLMIILTFVLNSTMPIDVDYYAPLLSQDYFLMAKKSGILYMRKKLYGTYISEIEVCY